MRSYRGAKYSAQCIATMITLLHNLCSGSSSPGVSINFGTVASYIGTPLALHSVGLNPTCTAVGFAPQTSLRFQWRFNGTNTSYGPVAAAGGTATATFTIVAPRRKDVGWYTCTVTGGNTSAQVSAYLNVAYVEGTLPTVTIEAVAGQNISLLCSMASFPPDVMLSYSWYRGAAISSSRILPQASQAYSVVNTSQSDAGSYLCSASNGYASGEVIFEVVVLTPPVIHKANTTYVTIGNTLRLNCIADSVQPPSYSWWSGNQLVANTSRITVSSGSSLLSVGQVAYSDSGVYTCVASNSVGQDTADFQVVVQGPPYVTVPNGGVVIALEGSSPSLVCMWLACPTPVVNWTMVGDGGVSRGVSGSRYSSPSVGTLLIGQVGGSDEGTYLCSFRNALGNMTAPIGLVVLEIPTGLVVSSVGGHTLQIQWNTITSRTHLDQYILEYVTQGSTVFKNVTFPGNSTAGMLTGLNGGTTYLLRLRAIKLGMKGPPGDQVMATTTTTVPVVTLVSVNPLEDGRSLQVLWHVSDAGGVSIQAINVTVRLNGTIMQTLAVQPPWPQSYLITGLMPTTTYTIEVSVGNAVGMSSVASPITTPLAPPATPTKPSILAETSHTISLKTSIDFVGSAPVQFILINVSELQSGLSQVLNVSVNDSSVVQSLNATMTSLGISLLIGDVGGGLQAYKTYTFSVAAQSAAGPSPYSEQSDPASLDYLLYAIAGGTGGVVLVIITILVCILCCACVKNCRRRRAVDSQSTKDHKGISNGYSSSLGREYAIRSSCSPSHLPSYSSCELHKEPTVIHAAHKGPAYHHKGPAYHHKTVDTPNDSCGYPGHWGSGFDYADTHSAHESGDLCGPASIGQCTSPYLERGSMTDVKSSLAGRGSMTDVKSSLSGRGSMADVKASLSGKESMTDVQMSISQLCGALDMKRSHFEMETSYNSSSIQDNSYMLDTFERHKSRYMTDV